MILKNNLPKTFPLIDDSCFNSLLNPFNIGMLEKLLHKDLCLSIESSLHAEFVKHDSFSPRSSNILKSGAEKLGDHAVLGDNFDMFCSSLLSSFVMSIDIEDIVCSA